ncbi:band 3 anion transport protein-like isoform X1 [Lytechinus pictus]|uniref:band 3 anion transport protein-like isoform X1 n=1 Tax=Lytechinus pictus TaxID=7653 RepID=UPI0030BA19CD
MSQGGGPTSSKEKSDASLDLQVEELLKPPEKLPLTSSPLDGEPENHFPQFGEKDYESHRSDNVLVHHQLEPLPKRGSSRSLRESDAQQQKIRTSQSSKSIADATEELITSIAEENVTDSVDGGEKSAPKFIIGEEDGTEPFVQSESQSDEKNLHTDANAKLNEKPGSHKHHRHHHHSHSKKQRNLSVDPNERLRQGSDVNLKMHDISIKIGGDDDDDDEEEGEMNPSIRETMAVHRLGDMSGGGRHHHSSHRHSVSSFVHVRGRRNSGEKKKKNSPRKKEFDHRPHEVFVELDELYKEEGHEMQWKEKARWIKYEEDVEEGAQRWGKPHVASLSFHSLVELRQYLEHATALFDLEETNLSTIFHRIVDTMINAGQIKEENRGDIMRALLLKHKHVNDGGNHNILRNFSTISLGSMDDKKGERHEKHHHHSGIFKNLSSISLTGHGQTKPESEVRIPMISIDGKPNTNGTPNDNQNASSGGFNTTPSSTSLMKLAHKLDNKKIEGIMRKIPQDAEVTSALVGEVDFLQTPAVSFVRLAEGAILDNFSEVPIPVRFLFVMLVPTDSDINYHELGRSFSTLMSNDHFHETAYRAESMRDLLTAMNTFIDHTIVLPPGDWDRELLLPVLRMQNEKMKKLRAESMEDEFDGDLTVTDITSKKRYPRFPDPLKRTGKIFGGLINDVRRRYPHYWSDIKDAFNFQCIAAFFFIFFAALSPAITFGGLLADKTENWVGVSETIIATALNGCIFALFSAQPLTIVGVTGPILVFEENLYSFCSDRNIEYLPFRVWVGIWLFVIITVMVAFEGSVLVQYFTRFTEEIFAFLIGLIFIYEVFAKLYKIFNAHPLLEDYCLIPGTDGFMNYTEVWTNSYTEYTNENGTVIYNLSAPGNMTVMGDCSSSKKVIEGQPNTALLSTILTLGTFFLAFFLRKFRQGRFLGRSARKMIGDFGIPISILVFVMVDFFVKPTYTQKLDVPDGLKPSDVCKRGWFVNPLGIDKPLGIGLMFAACIPALLAFILMYMETLITGLIINKKDNKMKKGSGYHLDTFLIGCMAVWNGLLGLPLVWAATVRSVTHIGALSVFSKSHAPGEKPKLIKVLEQRLTALFIHIVIGASIAISPLLRKVPLAVLFGVFLYMGVTSLNGIQMVERASLLFMPVKHHPDTRYVREVRTWRMHVFTIIQLSCLAILWIIKLTPAALAFSFFLILLVPIRSQLKRIFTKQELDALDSEEVDANDDEDDEYQTVHMPQ